MIHFNEWLDKYCGARRGIYTIDRAVDEYYNSLRMAKEYYPVLENGVRLADWDGINEYIDKVVDFAGKKVRYAGYGPDTAAEISVTEGHGWFYRGLMAPREDRDTEVRVSLNVRPDVELLKKLDGLLIRDQRREWIHNYKSPDGFNSHGWIGRHDPITIYLFKATPGFLREIADIAAPYVRKGPELIGEKIADGVYFDKEPIRERVLELFARLEKAPVVYKEIVEGNPRWAKGANLRMSAGEYYAIDKLITDLKNNGQEIDPQSFAAYIKWKFETQDKLDALSKQINIKNQTEINAKQTRLRRESNAEYYKTVFNSGIDSRRKREIFSDLAEVDNMEAIGRYPMRQYRELYPDAPVKDYTDGNGRPYSELSAYSLEPEEIAKLAKAVGFAAEIKPGGKTEGPVVIAYDDVAQNQNAKFKIQEVVNPAKAEKFTRDVEKLFRTMDIDNIVARDGREYTYFIYSRISEQDAAQLLAWLGLSVERHESSLYPRPVLRASGRIPGNALAFAKIRAYQDRLMEAKRKNAFEMGIARLVSVADMESVRSRDGKGYTYFVPRGGAIQDAAEKLGKLGVDFEQYRNGFFPDTVLRVPISKKNKIVLDRINMFASGK